MRTTQRGMLTLGLAILFGVQVGWEHAAAQPPDLLRSYRFVPRLSTLHQTGGFAGFDFRMHVFGSYDFVTGYEQPLIPLPVLRPYAEFANVEATVAHPLRFPGMPLEEAVDLASLEGRPIYHGPNGLEVFRFRGEDAQGMPFRMHIATMGRWMFMRGANDPSCCDFFEYDLRAIGHQVPSGDLDDDGEVGAADLHLWRAAYDSSDSLSDAGRYDGRDFLHWQRSFGDAAPSPAIFEAMMDAALAVAESATLSSVPEPSTALLLLSGAVAGGMARRRRS